MVPLDTDVSFHHALTQHPLKGKHTQTIIAMKKLKETIVTSPVNGIFDSKGSVPQSQKNQELPIHKNKTSLKHICLKNLYI